MPKTFRSLSRLTFASLVFAALGLLVIPQVSSAADVCFNVFSGMSISGVNVSGNIGNCAVPFSQENGPFGLPSGSIINIVYYLVNWLFTLLGILSLFGFVVAGLIYLLSAGDSDMATRAKDGVKYSIIGIAVGLSGYVIMQAIYWLLQGTGGDF